MQYCYMDIFDMPTEVWHTLWYEHALQSEQVFVELYVPF